MKNKIFLIISISILIFIFIIFYNGLHKINIYSPKVELNKKIPTYSSKLINSEKQETDENHKYSFTYKTYIKNN